MHYYDGVKLTEIECHLTSIYLTQSLH